MIVDISCKLVLLDNEVTEIEMRPILNVLKEKFNLTYYVHPDQLIECLNNIESEVDVLLVDVIYKEYPTISPHLFNGVSLQKLGLSILHNIRNGGFGVKWKNLPIIILTATTSSEVICHLDDIIKSDPRTKIMFKPVAPTALISEISRFIEKVM